MSNVHRIVRIHSTGEKLSLPLVIYFGVVKGDYAPFGLVATIHEPPSTLTFVPT